MESARTFLFLLFVFLTFLLYQEWQEAHAPIKEVKAPIETSLESYQPTLESVNLANNSQDKVSNLENNLSDDLSSQVPESVTEKTAPQPLTKNLQPIIVTTDTLKVVISPNGGNFVSAELLNHKETLDKDR